MCACSGQAAPTLESLQTLTAASLEFAEQQAKQRGFTRMQLATHALLTETVSLYQHLGWELVEQDDERVIMEKSIE